MPFDAKLVSDVGGRSGQEDNGWISPDPTTIVAAPADAMHFVVADGMGGHADGERASAHAVEAAAAGFRGELSCPPDTSTIDKAHNYLDFVLLEAHERIRAEARQSAHPKPMGSTAIFGILADWGCALIHCGDSRAYLFRAGKLKQLTKDQSLVQMMVDQGTINEAQMRTHRLKNVISANLGGDLGNPQEVHVSLQPGDILLVCTDGLNDALEDSVLASELAQGGTAEEISTRLVARAVAVPAQDNVTALVVVVS